MQAVSKEAGLLQQNLVEMTAMQVHEYLGKQWNCELKREADKALAFCYDSTTAVPGDGGSSAYKASFERDLGKTGFSTLLNSAMMVEMLRVDDGRKFYSFDRPPKPVKKAKPKPFTFSLPTK